MSKITVGISVYNDHEHLELLLQSIRWYTYQEDVEFDLVVCDDGTRLRNCVENAGGSPMLNDSSVASFNRIKDVCERFGATLIDHERNLGIPATWNHLAEVFDNEIIVLLNDDLIMPPNWLRVAHHFLEANKDHPNVGSCYWNPVPRVHKEVMRAMLPELGHTLFVTQDQVKGNELSFNEYSHTEVRFADGQGLGRVMCPCGCCFAFRREVFQEFGPFPEDFLSFHEESHFGTKCAEGGRAAFGFPYPRPYHRWGNTFDSNPELNHHTRMINSRAKYREFWKVPANIAGDKYFQWVDDQLMPKIPLAELKWLVPDYDAEPEMRSLPGGEVVALPKLVEKVSTF